MGDTVALVGNPNTGKTTIFNAISDSYANVGNWTGVTVSKKVGHLKGTNTQLVDLPGVYSLSPITKDESVVTQYLLTNHPDLILNVTNASQLQRNLLLTIEVCELGIPVLLDLNMIDDLHRSGYSYDLNQLGQQLHCKVLTTNARNHSGISGLKKQLGQKPAVSEPLKVPYPQEVESEVDKAVFSLVNSGMKSNFARWLVLQYINGCQPVRQYASAHHLAVLTDNQQRYDDAKLADVIYNSRLHFIEQVLNSCRKLVDGSYRPAMTAKIDAVVTNKYLGLPIFILIFYLIFKISFDWIGTPCSNFLDSLISGPISSTASRWLVSVGAIAPLRSLIVNGIISGVGGVLVFIPQIFSLFACISILEDSGYMARAALVTDRIMQQIGLNGKSFIPLIIGFGCNVPGIMAARTIEQPRERLVTILIEPFMSCSARLPIYSLFVASFFPKHQALIVLSLYFLGIVVALVVAKGYQIILGAHEPSTFVVELPEYHWPRLDITLRSTWDKGKGFIHKAGTVIFAGTVIIWLLSNFSVHGYTTSISSSFAADIGRFVQPVFAPMGVVSWQAISALITGVMAKEVITSSMMVLFHSSNQAVLIGALSHYFTPLAAYSLLVFILLYIPCLATIATMHAETGTWKWPLISIGSSLVIAYIVAFLVHSVGSLLGIGV